MLSYVSGRGIEDCVLLFHTILDIGVGAGFCSMYMYFVLPVFWKNVFLHLHGQV